MSDAKTTTEQDNAATMVPCGCDGRCEWHGECEREVWPPDSPQVIPYCDVCFCGEYGDILWDEDWGAIAARRGGGWVEAMRERVRTWGKE